jgi:hypothetical protein
LGRVRRWGSGLVVEGAHLGAMVTGWKGDEKKAVNGPVMNGRVEKKERELEGTGANGHAV